MKKILILLAVLCTILSIVTFFGCKPKEDVEDIVEVEKYSEITNISSYYGEYTSSDGNFVITHDAKLTFSDKSYEIYIKGREFFIKNDSDYIKLSLNDKNEISLFDKTYKKVVYEKYNGDDFDAYYTYDDAILYVNDGVISYLDESYHIYSFNEKYFYYTNGYVEITYDETQVTFDGKAFKKLSKATSDKVSEIKGSYFSEDFSATIYGDGLIYTELLHKSTPLYFVEDKFYIVNNGLIIVEKFDDGIVIDNEDYYLDSAYSYDENITLSGKYLIEDLHSDGITHFALLCKINKGIFSATYLAGESAIIELYDKPILTKDNNFCLLDGDIDLLTSTESRLSLNNNVLTYSYGENIYSGAVAPELELFTDSYEYACFDFEERFEIFANALLWDSENDDYYTLWKDGETVKAKKFKETATTPITITKSLYTDDYEDNIYKVTLKFENYEQTTLYYETKTKDELPIGEYLFDDGSNIIEISIFENGSTRIIKRTLSDISVQYCINTYSCLYYITNDEYKDYDYYYYNNSSNSSHIAINFNYNKNYIRLDKKGFLANTQKTHIYDGEYFAEIHTSDFDYDLQATIFGNSVSITILENKSVVSYNQAKLYLVGDKTYISNQKVYFTNLKNSQNKICYSFSFAVVIDDTYYSLMFTSSTISENQINIDFFYSPSLIPENLIGTYYNKSLNKYFIINDDASCINIYNSNNLDYLSSSNLSVGYLKFENGFFMADYINSEKTVILINDNSIMVEGIEYIKDETSDYSFKILNDFDELEGKLYNTPSNKIMRIQNGVFYITTANTRYEYLACEINGEKYLVLTYGSDYRALKSINRLDKDYAILNDASEFYSAKPITFAPVADSSKYEGAYEREGYTLFIHNDGSAINVEYSDDKVEYLTSYTLQTFDGFIFDNYKNLLYIDGANLYYHEDVYTLMDNPPEKPKKVALTEYVGYYLNYTSDTEYNVILINSDGTAWTFTRTSYITNRSNDVYQIDNNYMFNNVKFIFENGNIKFDEKIYKKLSTEASYEKFGAKTGLYKVENSMYGDFTYINAENKTIVLGTNSNFAKTAQLFTDGINCYVYDNYIDIFKITINDTTISFNSKNYILSTEDNTNLISSIYPVTYTSKNGDKIDIKADK